jgi:hypothetical protein
VVFPYPRWIPLRRSTRWRIARALKLVLCAVLVVGLLPGSEEVVETVAHLVHDGHLPHSEAHDEVAATEDCDGSAEHGCTPLAHHCECCASVSAIPGVGPTATPIGVTLRTEKYRSPAERGPPNDGVEPFLPPPIA